MSGYRCVQHMKNSMVLEMPRFSEHLEGEWIICHRDGTRCEGSSILMENHLCKDIDGNTYTIGQVKRMREIGAELEAKRITAEQAMKRLLEI